MIVANELTFEYESITGAYTIKGPMFKFKVRAEYTLQVDAPTLYIDIVGGRLLVYGEQGFIEVGDLTPEAGFSRVSPGGKFPIELRAQFSPESFQRLLEIASNSRRFQIQVFYRRYLMYIRLVNEPLIKNELGGLFSLYHGVVGGKVDGLPNVSMFKVDAEEWARAVENTKAAQYVTHSLLILNTDKEPIKELLEIIKKAEELLLKGQIKEPLAKVREICDWFGHKNKNQEDRYSRLKSFDLSDSERENLVNLLDVLWDWSSKGHHYTPEGYVCTEEQAWMSIHMGYLILSYLSRKQMIQPV